MGLYIHEDPGSQRLVVCGTAVETLKRFATIGGQVLTWLRRRNERAGGY